MQLQHCVAIRMSQNIIIYVDQFTDVRTKLEIFTKHNIIKNLELRKPND